MKRAREEGALRFLSPSHDQALAAAFENPRRDLHIAAYTFPPFLPLFLIPIIFFCKLRISYTEINAGEKPMRCVSVREEVDLSGAN